MATQKRAIGLNASPIRSYHIVSRVVDKTFHLEQNEFKTWMVKLLKRLSSAYAVGVYGYAIMSNHFHLVVQWEPHVVHDWSDQEVLKRWEIAHPIRNNHNDLASDESYIEQIRALRLSNPAWLADARAKLANISYFMRDFKATVSIYLNKKTGRQGTLWEGAFKLDALKDEYDLKQAMSYVDLNPFAAGIGETPEESQHCSLRERAQTMQKLDQQGSEQDNNSWLRGFKDKLSLKDYLEYVDRVARAIRKDKKQLEQGVANIIERVELSIKEMAQQASDQEKEQYEHQIASMRTKWSRWLSWD